MNFKFYVFKNLDELQEGFEQRFPILCLQLKAKVDVISDSDRKSVV